MRTNPKIAEANAAVKKLAEKYHAKYMDINDPLKDENGNLKAEYTIEGMHIKEEGYRAISRNLSGMPWNNIVVLQNLIKESRTTALHYSDRVIYYIKFNNCHGYLMTGVCQEFCIQRIQTARWRDIADAQSFLVMQLRRETGIWG